MNDHRPPTNAERIKQLYEMADQVYTLAPLKDTLHNSKWVRYLIESLIAVLEQLEEQNKTGE